MRVFPRLAGLVGVACFLGTPSLLAEEAVHGLSSAAPFLAYAVVPAARLDVFRFTRSKDEAFEPANLDNSLFEADLTLSRTSKHAAPSDERYYGELSRQRTGDGLLAEGSVILFRTPVPTRFNYRSYAGFHGGYGQIFSSPDTIGRSRTNGAGLDDPSCVYVKMSLNF